MPTRPLVTRYEDDLALLPDRWGQAGLALALVVALAFPFVAGSHWLTVGNMALVAVVGSVSLMILTGFAGQISLGHAAFLALGAYTVAVLSERWGVPFWLGLPAGGLVAAAMGLLVGPFALRLRGLYLAIVTLGLLFVVNHALHSLPDLTHGVSGIAVAVHGSFPGPGDRDPLGNFTQPLEIGPLTLIYKQKLYFVFLLLAAVTTLWAVRLARSNTGRAMMAVRDQDLAASTLGVHPARVKIIAFVLSSFLAGIAGGMFALQQQYLTIEPPFDLEMSIQYIAMIVLGGIGTVFGAVWGALVYVFLTPLAESVGRHIPLLNELSSAQQSTLLFSVAVCVILVFEPLGLLGIWLRVKRYFLGWPFRY
jgi:branched-chain amino acid transport system permease protein